MEQLKHECGIAVVRLLKPTSYYIEKYGSSFYGMNKLYLLMEKQHNRGQEAAGLGCVKLDVEPGNEYIFRERAEGTTAIQEIFASARKDIEKATAAGVTDIEKLPYNGEIYMGHLRYSTFATSGVSFVHPFLRRNNWRSRNLMLCGNFNMTNVQDIFDSVVAKGQHPRVMSDTFILLEQLGYELDKEHQRSFDAHKGDGTVGPELATAIENDIDIKKILKSAAPMWDGGFVICGATGGGSTFVLRDKNGIRPAFYYMDDEIVIVASERPVVQTAMNLSVEQVKELTPGTAMIINKTGKVEFANILGEGENKRCSFESIYFSRGGDVEIYHQRKQLGLELTEPILKSINYDISNSILSFIPNTAEIAYNGMIEGIEAYLNDKKVERILALDKNAPGSLEQMKEIMAERVRIEKIAFKDIKLRTFISEGDVRDELAAHVYDVTYGLVNPGVDNIVVIDDSIVRGTTLKQSIIRIMDRLNPKKVVIVSSSPQVRYPDYYGIDMSSMDEFCAFRAAIELLKDRGMEDIIDRVYENCKAQLKLELNEMTNPVKEIYNHFSVDDVTKKITEILTPKGTKADVEIVYQTLEGLHKSVPNRPGDWYFSGDYPTAGGMRRINMTFISYYENKYIKSKKA